MQKDLFTRYLFLVVILIKHSASIRHAIIVFIQIFLYIRDMKYLKTILRILGSIFILFNLLAYLSSSHTEYPDGANGTADLMAYYTGKNLLIVAGILLFFLAYRINRKLRKNKENEMIDAFLSS